MPQNDGWNRKDKQAFVKGVTGSYQPDYIGNLMSGLGLNSGPESTAQAAQAGRGIIGPNAQAVKDALARKLQSLGQD